MGPPIPLVLDFWWRLLWVSEPEWAALFALGGGVRVTRDRVFVFWFVTFSKFSHYDNSIVLSFPDYYLPRAPMHMSGTANCSTWSRICWLCGRSRSFMSGRMFGSHSATPSRPSKFPIALKLSPSIHFVFPMGRIHSKYYGVHSSKLCNGWCKFRVESISPQMVFAFGRCEWTLTVSTFTGVGCIHWINVLPVTLSSETVALI